MTYAQSGISDRYTYSEAEFTLGETAQLYLGALGGGALIGVLGGAFGTAFNGSCSEDDFICLPGGTIIGAALGLELGLIAGTHLVGHIQGKRGSIIASTVGTILSTVAMGFYVSSIDDVEFPGSPQFFIGSSLLIFLSGPVIGYTLFADEKVKIAETAFFFDRSGKIGVKTDLISMTF